MATWYIVDGNLPYLEEFPPMPSIDDAPNSLWKIIDGDLPFKSAFPQMHTIDDAPLVLWKIIDGDLPFKSLFPKMYTYKPFGGINNVIKGDDVVDNIYYESTMLRGAYLGEFKVFKQPIGR